MRIPIILLCVLGLIVYGEKLIKLPKEGSYFKIISPPESIKIKSGLVTLAPQKNVGKHSTENHEELIICLDGNGEVNINDKTKIKFEKEEVIYIPPHHEHDVANIGKTELKYIYVVSKLEK